MRAYSTDLRERNLADRLAGMPTQQVATKYRVSPAFVRRLTQRHRESGEVAPRSSRNRRVPLAVAHGEAIRAYLAEQTDLTLCELRDRLKLAVSLAELWQAIKRLGLI